LFLHKIVEPLVLEGTGSPQLVVDRLGFDLQELVGRGQSPAQVVQELAQVGACLGFRGIGPEEKGKPLARLGGVAIK